MQTPIQNWRPPLTPGGLSGTPQEVASIGGCEGLGFTTPDELLDRLFRLWVSDLRNKMLLNASGFVCKPERKTETASAAATRESSNPKAK